MFISPFDTIALICDPGPAQITLEVPVRPVAEKKPAAKPPELRLVGTELPYRERFPKPDKQEKPDLRLVGVE